MRFLLTALLVPGTLGAQGAPVVTEWRVPWSDTRPRDPAVAPDGRVWFVGQAGNYVAVLDPRSGGFRRYEIDPGTFPHNVVIAPDGAPWFAGNRNGMIGRLDPATGEIRRFPMPAADLTDPHTLVFDRSGNLWFTLQGSNAVAHLDVRTGSVRVVRLPGSGSRPYGIALDSRDRPWFAEFGANRIGTIDPAGFTLREFSIPDPASRPRRIVITADDRIYAGDYARGKLVSLDPATGRFEEWDNPAGHRSAPYAMAGDDRGRVWQVETGVQPNRLVGFDPASRTFSAPVPVLPSGGVVIRNMSFDPRTRSLWFGTDAGTIGRAALGPAGAATGATP
jgi:virginiamycin B lyase